MLAQKLRKEVTSSESLFSRASRVIAGGVNSPARSFAAVGGTPLFFSRAQGAYLYDADDKPYIDYVGAYGPAIAGHNHPEILRQINNQLCSSIVLGAPCEKEIILAEEIVKRFASIERVRMTASGTEATMTAIRLARGITGRNKIIKFYGGYHGHHDSLLQNAGSGVYTHGQDSSCGIPEIVSAQTLCATFNDLCSVEKLMSGEIAAIIIEPVTCNMGVITPKLNFLQGLRKLCDKHGSLLIFDECMTGFRIHEFGAQGLYDINADITTFGKNIGSGFAASGLGASAEIMEHLSPQGSIYHAGTLAGNPLAMTAAIATLSLLDSAAYQKLALQTKKLAEGLLAVNSPVSFQVNFFPGMLSIFFSDAKICSHEQVLRCNKSRYAQFFHFCINHGVYLPPSPFEALLVSLAHDDNEINLTLEIMRKALTSLT